MNIKILVASAVAVAGIGAGGYFVVSNDVAVNVNVPAESTDDFVRTDDFRKLIPNYESLSFGDKSRAIKNVYDALGAEQKIAAKQELTALADEVNRKALENIGTSTSKGYTPKGWEN